MAGTRTTVASGSNPSPSTKLVAGSGARTSWIRRLVLFVAIYASVVGLVVLLALTHSGFALVVGAAMIAVFGLVFHSWLAQRVPLARRAGITVGMLVIGCALFLIWRSTRIDGLGFAGVVTMFFAAAELMATCRQTTGPSTLRLVGGLAATAAAATIFFCGFAALGHWGGWPTYLCIAAILFAPVGMQLLAEEVLDRRWLTHVAFVPSVAISLVVAVVAAVWLGGVTSVTLFLAGAVFLLVGAIVSNTNADVVAVVIVALVVLGNTPKPADLPATLEAGPNQHVVVVLGDSYTSGEGAKHYYANTNVPELNTCRRSTTSYGGNIELGGAPTIFVACSGATADQLWNASQYSKEPTDWTTLVGAPASATIPTVVPGRPQVASVQRHDEQYPAGPNLGVTPDLVVVGVGGNDAGFGEVATTCVGPGDCATIGQHWLDNMSTNAAPAVDRSFDAISTAFPGVPVLVVPYPIPISPIGCEGSAFSADEHRFLNAFTNQLDDLLKAEAAKHQYLYLSEMRSAFDEHRICDASAQSDDVNTVALDSVSGALEDDTDVVNWLHDSMHPKETGQTRMMDVANTWIADHSTGGKLDNIATIRRTTPDDAPTGPTSFTAASITQIMGPGFTADPASNSVDPGLWQQGEIRAALLQSAVALGLILVGAAMFWLRIITRRRTGA